MSPLVEVLAGCPSGGGCGVECGDADQVVNGGEHFEPGAVAVLSDVSELPSGPNGLTQPKVSSTRLRLRWLDW